MQCNSVSQSPSDGKNFQNVKALKTRWSSTIKETVQGHKVQPIAELKNNKIVKDIKRIDVIHEMA